MKISPQFNRAFARTARHFRLTRKQRELALAYALDEVLPGYSQEFAMTEREYMIERMRRYIERPTPVDGLIAMGKGVLLGFAILLGIVVLIGLIATIA